MRAELPARVQTVAVTGATGFIGRHVMRELLAVGARVTALTREPAKLAEFGDRIAIVRHDLADSPEGLFARLGEPDALLHLAWDGLPDYRSLGHFETELPRQYRFLKSLLADGLRSLVVTGTCFEYGLQSGPLCETLEPKPANPYAFAKDALRRELCFLQQSSAFRLTWARLFYLYGEGQAKSSLWSQLRQAVADGLASFNMSGGEQLRDFLPVETLAKYLVALTLSPADRGILNLCSGQPVSVRKLVESWIDCHRWPITLNLGYYPYPDYEALAFWGDDTKLKACLWAPNSGGDS